MQFAWQDPLSKTCKAFRKFRRNTFCISEPFPSSHGRPRLSTHPAEVRNRSDHFRLFLNVPIPFLLYIITCIIQFSSPLRNRGFEVLFFVEIFDRATRTTVAVECRRIGILFSRSHSFRQEGGGAAVGDRAGLVSVAKDKAQTTSAERYREPRREWESAPSAAMRAARAPL